MRAYFIIAVLTISTLVSFGQEAQESKPFARPDLPGKMILDYGFNILRNNPSEFGNVWLPSKSVGLHYVREFFLIDEVSVSIGAGLGFEKISFVGNKTLFYNDTDNTLTFGQSPTTNVRKSKLGMTYFQVPIDVRYYPMGEGKGSRFFVGLGAYLGYRLNSQTKLVYNRGNSIQKAKVRSDFGMNDFRYGVTGKLGFDSFHIISKFDLSKLFESDDSPLTGNVNLLSVGFAVDTF